MTRLSVKPGPIAIIRANLPLPDQVYESLVEGGIELIEITLGTPNCLETVARWLDFDGASIGVGSIRTAEHARQAIDGGAQFLVTPTMQSAVLKASSESEIPVVCGAMSPTEVDSAWQQGAASVKIFPADSLGKVSYIKSIKGPLPEILLSPTGGVSVDDAKGYAAAGCWGVGVGSNLVSDHTLENRDWSKLATRAGDYQRAWAEGVLYQDAER